MEWEKVDHNKDNNTYRLKVHNGWIVKIVEKIIVEHYDSEEFVGKLMTSVFVPDYNHEWILK